MLSESQYKSEWIKTSCNVPITFVGREVVCFGSGCQLNFFNLTNNEVHIYTANKYETGDGIKCYTGHKHMQIFAFAETLADPRIFIISYPDLSVLRIIEHGALLGYLRIAFSEQSYLLSLSDSPDIELVVWNWRTKDKLLAVNTGIVNSQQSQSLCLSPCTLSLFSAVQYTENCDKFLLWDIYNTYKQCEPIKHEVQMPQNDTILNCCWNQDNVLFILNRFGCIYQMNSEYTLDVVLYRGTYIGTVIPCFTWYHGGLLTCLTNGDIKYFKKTSGTWFEEWTVPPVKLKQLLTSSAKDLVVGWTYQAEILEFDLSKHCFNFRKSYQTTSNQICCIYPTCNHFVSLNPDIKSLVQVWESLTGEEVGRMEVKGIVTVIASNPRYPYVAIGLSNGTMTLMNCYTPDNPRVLTNLNLYREQITKIVFSINGDIIVTANLFSGLIFIIRGTPGNTMEILHFIDYRRQALDVTVNEDEKYINLYILVLTDAYLLLSQRIVVKSISKTSNRIKKKKFITQKFQFTHLRVVNRNVFIAKLFQSKVICILQFLKKSIKILQEIHTGHYLRHFRLSSDPNYVYTYGYDGLIIIRNHDLDTIVGALLPHHRYTGGVEKVIVDPYMRYVLSLGARTNELVCSKLTHKTVDDNVLKDIYKKYLNMKSIFNIPTIGFEPPDGETYLEERRKIIVKQEEIQCAKERESIMSEFLILKEEVVTLLNQNLKGPKLEKIDILDFYQHTLLRQHKEEINKKKCEWTVKYYIDLIRAQDEVWRNMKKKFYESMESTGVQLKGIFSAFSVESYSVAPGATQQVESALQSGLMREFENMLREGDLFRPWENYPDHKILQNLERPPVIYIKSESTRIKEALDLEIGISGTDLSSTELAFYPGDTVRDFIQPNPLLYDQSEMHTYLQIIIQLKLLDRDRVILRNLLNEKFSELRQQKMKDMNLVLEKNNRLRYILSELHNTELYIEDPKWHPSEDIQNIITVKEFEIGITPYISPSEQAILDWQAAEAERIRLLLLADDFRERALIKMMDGVLEIRWEDTLKRQIPQPKCMLEKEPDTFNEEDLRAIKDYEEKVAFLNYEKQMYKNILEAEYQKTSELVREVIKKFNLRLRELLLYKIKIESARIQQSFVSLRQQFGAVERLKFRKQEIEIIELIDVAEKHVISIQQKIFELNDLSNECRQAGEELSVKDKLIERNFRRDFQDFSALIQEQGFKLFKKNPKMSAKGIVIAPLLIALGTCCVTQEKSALLTQDCIEYLRSLDTLDQYVGVPNTIDEAMYKIICKHRRLRIDNELKTKANSVQQQDIEVAIQSFQKYLATQKEHVNSLINRLHERRQETLKFINDKMMQIVIKKGLVEVPTNGEIKNFENAIMINRKDVESINELILKVGARKIQVMNEKMIHRRDILLKEWEHNKMKMQIEDLNEHLHMIQHVKVTKEVQQYLRLRAKGESFDKGTLSLDQEIEGKKQTYEKILYERQIALNEIETQIKEYKKKNQVLDHQIVGMNIDVCEQRESRDLEFERHHKIIMKQRMKAILTRSNLVKKIQDQHNEILVLQTELELLRLKTYPTLKFEILL